MIQEFIIKNLITIIFLIYLIYGLIKGFDQGFVKKVLSFGSIIVTIVLTKYLTPLAAEFVKNVTNIEATLTDTIYSVLMKTEIYDNLDLEGIDNIIGTGDLAISMKENLCTNISNIIINLGSGIIVFIIILITIKIILKILDVIDYIPLIGQFNKVCGAGLGAIEVIVIVWSLFTIIRVLDQILGNITQIGVLITSIESSFLVGTLYKNNFIYNFLSHLFSVFA